MAQMKKIINHCILSLSKVLEECTGKQKVMIKTDIFLACLKILKDVVV